MFEWEVTWPGIDAKAGGSADTLSGAEMKAAVVVSTFGCGHVKIVNKQGGES